MTSRKDKGATKNGVYVASNLSDERIMPCQCGCIAAWTNRPNVRLVRHLHRCEEYRLFLWTRREAEIRLNVDSLYVRHDDEQPVRWQ